MLDKKWLLDRVRFVKSCEIGFAEGEKVFTEAAANRRNSLSRKGESEEAPPGFEPGLADLQSATGLPQPGNQSTTSDKGDLRRVRALHSVVDMDSDLERVVAAWPDLTSPIRAAVLALIDTVAKTP